MAEVSNSTLALLVFAALIVSVASLVVRFGDTGLSGFATSDTGNVTLTIADSLNIRVDPGNATIDFGTCTPRAATPYTCASNDTIVCDGVAGGNCTGDTATPQFIRVENVGNVEASVNVSITADCSSAAQLIGGTAPALNFMTTDCQGTNVTTWTTLDGTTRLACSNITPTTGAFHMFAQVTIPNDASPASCGEVSTLTFSAIQI